MSKPETPKPGSQQQVVSCPRCGKNEWTHIPCSLADACPCGYVRVLTDDGQYEPGATLQQWAADLAKAKGS